MPFTPTHIVAILPVARLFRWLPFSALAIGAMVPDLPMFFPIAEYSQTHSINGVPLVCLPIGVTCFILFQAVIKEPVLALLPIAIQSRAHRFSETKIQASAAFWICVAVAIMLGAYSHLLWDSFSHKGRWGTQIIPVLNREFDNGGWSLPGFKIIQYGSTFVGLPALAIFGVLHLRSAPATAVSTRQVSGWQKAIVLIVLSVVPVVVSASSFQRKPLSIRNSARRSQHPERHY